jgi:tryptophanyl-tRNA synthetase
MLVPGTDGEKMSKSRGNFIDIFQADKPLRKQIMSIETDSTPLEDAKNTDTCNVFALYQLIATHEQIASMRANYATGGYGYGHAKQALYEVIVARFEQERTRFNHFMENKHEIDAALEAGAVKARVVANATLARVRAKLGYNNSIGKFS